jgi:flagellar protein FliO/FliZ
VTPLGALPAASYGWYLAQTLLALAAVCLIAILALRYGLRRLSVFGGREGGRIKVVERVAMDARRSLYLVDVGGRLLLLGAGDGPMTLLAEIDAASLPPVPERRRLAFRDILSRAAGGKSER